MTAQTLHFVSLTNNNVSFTVNNGKTPQSRKVKSDGTFSKKGHKYLVCDNTITLMDSDSAANVTETAVKTAPLQPLQSEFPINQRFEFLNTFVNMVLNGDMASAIVTGEGGLGKSHSITSALEERGMEEDVNYVMIKGYATPKALYATLFENRKGLVIFDDCDSVLKDPTAVNILKGALDSYDKRTISWLSRGFSDDDLPSSFEFEGQIIFISNLNSDKIDQAVKSRSITIDLSMSMQDRIERMQHILPNILPDYSMKIKETALEFMASHSDEAREFNMRTLMKATKVIKAYGINNEEWKSAVKYLLVSV